MHELPHCVQAHALQMCQDQGSVPLVFFGSILNINILPGTAVFSIHFFFFITAQVATLHRQAHFWKKTAKCC